MGALSKSLIGKNESPQSIRDLTSLDADDVEWLCAHGEEHKAAELYLKSVFGKSSQFSVRGDFARALDGIALFFYFNAPGFTAFVDLNPAYRRGADLEDPNSAALLREAFLCWCDKNYAWTRMANAILGDETRS